MAGESGVGFWAHVGGFLFGAAAALRKGGDPKGAREAFGRARAHPASNEQMQDAVSRALAELDAAPPRQ